MTDDAPVRFRCAPADAGDLPRPRTATEVGERDPDVDPVVFGAAQADPRVSDLVNRGWFLYPPGEVRLDPDDEPPVGPADAAYLDAEDPPAPGTAAATVDTGWSVAVDDDCPVLVTAWTWRLGRAVLAQLVTGADCTEAATGAEDGAVDLRLPVVTDEPVTFDPDEPIAQVIPLPNAIQSSSFEAGAFDEDGEDEVRRLDRQFESGADPYGEWHVEKAPTRLVGLGRFEE